MLNISSNICIKLVQTGNTIYGTLTNSEDTDEIPPNAAFRQGLHCLPRQNSSTENEIQCSGDPSKYTMEHPGFTVFSFME